MFLYLFYYRGEMSDPQLMTQSLQQSQPFWDKVFSLADIATSAFAPHSCVVCMQESSLLHAWCADHLPLTPSMCHWCGGLNSDSSRCSSCRSKTPVEYLFVRTKLSGPARELTFRYKFSYARQAHKVIAREIHATLPQVMPGFALCGAPTSSRHIRSRGFDHNRLVVAELAKLTGLPVFGGLRRTKHTKQVGQKRQARLVQQKGVFAVDGAAPDKILLIDDVFTTGATLSECARVLKGAGTKHVYAAVFAKS